MNSHTTQGTTGLSPYRTTTMKVIALTFGLALLFSNIAFAQPIRNYKVNANQRAEVLFSKVFNAMKRRSPEFQTELGLKTSYGLWDENTPAHDADTLKLNTQFLDELSAIRREDLSQKNKLSHRLLQHMLEDEVTMYEWRHHYYPVNQMFGRHSEMASILIDQHSIDNSEHAQAYIQRTRSIEQQIDRLINKINAQEKLGILPPKYVFAKVIDSCKNLLKGAPFKQTEIDSPLLADFAKKVNGLNIPPQQKSDLINREKSVLLSHFQPAYLKLINKLEQQEKKADNTPGVWKHPKGNEYYLASLRSITTTNFSPKEIHELGLKEVQRIKTEMKAIASKASFKGDLQAFFKFIETNKQFYYPNSDSGKQKYLADTNTIIGDIKKRLPELFNVQPKAELIVKPVEAYREKSAGIAFYQQPAIDGSRPGMYYANLYRMEDMPNYSMEALAYHEALPGHHMQIAIAQELEQIPDFRKHTYHTAYVEGWGLYSELLPKEIGLYKNLYSDFGRLKMEMLRACRLVTDTGIHALKWDKDKAVTYLRENMPISEQDATKAIERYSVLPGQATAYKIGMLEILRLRELAKNSLGKQFDIRNFHDVVLKNGSLPLSILEEQVQQWIEQSQK